MSGDARDRKLEDFARLWLAHDGLWFLGVEERFGIKTAIEIDKAAWAQFSPLEAKRIMERLGLSPGGGIPSLVTALGERMYALINQQQVLEADDKRAVYVMTTCRVQEARRRKGLAPFPCKEVGLVEYSQFAKTIDPRIQTRCLGCPPDELTGDFWCKWEFVIE